MSEPHPVQAVTPEAAPVAPVAAVPKAGELLNGDEIIQLSIKPAPWFIVLLSYKWVLAMGLLAGAFALGAGKIGAYQATLGFQGALCIALLRLGFAMLQWASRTYILTNQRVMQLRGVMNVSVTECRLSRISRADLHVASYQRWLRLGTIHMHPIRDGAPIVAWEQLARPSEIHEILLKAIRRAQSGD